MKKPKVYRYLSSDYIKKIASLLAMKEKVSVVSSSSWAMNVKDKVLYYDANSLQRFNEDHVLALLLHEIGHLNYTGDINTSSDIFKKYPQISKSYINALEDIRIDSLMSQRYVNSFELMEALHEQSTAHALNYLQKIDEETAHVKMKLREAVQHIKGMAEDLPDEDKKQAVARITKQTTEALKEREQLNDAEKVIYGALAIYYRNLSPLYKVKVMATFKQEEHREIVEDILNKMDEGGIEFMPETDDVQNYWEKEIFPIIEKLLPPQGEKHTKEQKQMAGMGMQGLNQMNSQSSDKPDDRGKGSAKVTGYDDEGRQIQESVKKASNDGEAKDMTRAPAAAAGMQEGNPDGEAFVSDPSKAGSEDGGADKSNYGQAQALVRGNVSNLSSRLNRILRDNSFTRSGGRYRSGQLRKRGLYQFFANETRLFQRKREAGNKSYAVSILIDGSGSMEGKRWNESLKATALLVDSMAKLKIPVEVTVFSNKSRLAKPFHQPIHARMFDQNANEILFGGTELTDGFRKAIQSISARHETEKIMIVLTDGELSYRDENEIPGMISSNRHIKYYGIGIEVDIGKHFDYNINVKNAEEVPVQFAQILKSNIRRN